MNIKAFLKKVDIGIIISAVFVLFALLPLMREGFFTMHDDEQVGRLYELDLSLTSGHIPPRMSQNLGFGYGYPFFNFYPSYAYYIAEVFHVLGFSFVTSTKLMIAAGFIAASVFMYLFSKQYLSKVGSVVASVLYTYAPYHSVDVYVRGALPEFLTFAFIPALFWSLSLLRKKAENKFLILTSFFGASLILTHNLITVMSAPFFLAFFLFLLFTEDKKIRFLIQCFIAGIIALGLSSYFWLPSYVERNLTLIEILTKDLADYSLHFVYLRQFWNSAWGYGGSMFGLGDGLSYEIGKIHIVLVAISALAVVVFLRKKIKIYMLFFLLFLFSIFMSSFYSQKVWDFIPQLSYVQFPWRFLLFTAFTSSFLGGFVVSTKHRRASVTTAVVIIGVTIFYMLPFFQPYKYLPEADDRYYTNKEFLRWNTSYLAAEYVPKGVATRNTDYGTTIVDIPKDQIAKSVYTLQKGKADIKVIEDLPHKKVLESTSSSDTQLRLNIYSFPGWVVLIDGKKVNVAVNNRLKLMTITVPKGSHRIEALFTNTPVREIANIVSLITLVTVILYVLAGKRFLPKRIHAKTS